MKGLQLNAKSIFGALISLFVLFVTVYIISRAWRSGREGRLLGYRMGGAVEEEESSFKTCPEWDDAISCLGGVDCAWDSVSDKCYDRVDTGIRRRRGATAVLEGAGRRPPRVPYVGGAPSRAVGGVSAPKPTVRRARRAPMLRQYGLNN